MENIIVVANDAQYALQLIAPMKNEAIPTRWIVLICPPKFKRHVSKWVNRGALKSWRRAWAEQAAKTIEPVLTSGSDQMHWQCCHRALVNEVDELKAVWQTHRVLDARIPLLGASHDPVSAAQPMTTHDRWSVPGGVAMMGVMLVTAAD